MATNKNLVRIRLEGNAAVITKEADQIVQFLEEQGHMVMEQTRPYQRREPDGDTSRLYISAVINGGDHGQQS
jgi:hypothetical protein